MSCYISRAHVRLLSCLGNEGCISRDRRARRHQKFHPHSVTFSLFVSRTVNQWLEICQKKNMLLTLHIHHSEKAHWKSCLDGINNFIMEHNLAQNMPHNNKKTEQFTYSIVNMYCRHRSISAFGFEGLTIWLLPNSLSYSVSWLWSLAFMSFML